MVDVVVYHDGGSIVSFRLQSEAAREWVDENVQSESWQWMGNALCVEHRFASMLFDGMSAAGLEVVA